MAQPTPYEQSHEFLTDEGANPSFPGSELDVEFSAVKTTTDEILENLAKIQRDDGAVQNRTVGYDQLTDEMRSGGMVTFAPWASEIYYVENRIVVNGSSLYRALETHTSGTFATDLANEKWVLLGNLPASTVPGPQGDKGWSPEFSAVTDGARRVLRVVDWQGGAGTEPDTGLYVGASGLVEAIGDAVDIRGPQGAAGDMQGPGSAVVGNVAVFANTDGTELDDGGVALSDLATESYADAAAAAAAAALVDSSPSTLDTLNELASALGDDPNFVTTVTNALAAKVPGTRALTAGAGLTGGGDLSSDRSFAVGAGTGITVNADDVAVAFANTSEANAGTEVAKSLSPDVLAGSNFGKTVVSILVFDDSQNVAVADGAGDAFWRVPSALNGMNLVEVAAHVQTAGTTNTTDIQIARTRSGSTVDMLSTKITIDSTEVDTITAAAAAVINTSNDDVATGDRIRIDVDAVSTTPPKGLIVELTFQLP